MKVDLFDSMLLDCYTIVNMHALITALTQTY